jgi:PrgI family protein
MRFSVPQFIERESKIVGPLSLRQFAYIAVAAVLCFTVYFTAPIYYFFFSVIVFGGMAVGLAFVKVNGRNLPVMIMNAIKFSLSSKVYLWEKKKTAIPVVLKKIEMKEETKGEKYKLKRGGSLGDLKRKINTK